MRRHLSNILLVLIFIAGLSLLLYPPVSEYWNSLHQSRTINSYVNAVEEMDEDLYEELLESAREYNTWLFEEHVGFTLTNEEQEEYRRQLDVDGTGVLSFITIDKIGLSLPIYHGTEDSILQVAIGHLEGTSLPVGGESTHCVLSGHRGLPSATLFSNLDELEVGDTWVIQTLDETLTYEVDLISIVEPYETEGLKIVEGEDLCTLVTCTPYGVNSHRLLVRGHRVENSLATELHVSTEAVRVETILIAPVFAAPLLILLLLWLLFHTGRSKKGEKQHEDNKTA